jgi:fructose-bisphosphate aldolase class I
LFDETFSQSQSDGKTFLQTLAGLNIIAGIKVDTGLANLAGFPDQKLTQGLDGLRERLQNYAAKGAQFAKWRSVSKISAATPDQVAIQSNALQLAVYAALCQECGLVPIVEPEILMDGPHTIQQCCMQSERVLDAVFHQLHRHRVMLEGLILKINMILPGSDSPVQATPDEVAEKTVRTLLRYVPPAVPGIVFLSGGQTPDQATLRLNVINARFKASTPWPMGFSFSRAIQQPVLAKWLGEENNREAAQHLLIHRVRCNQAALNGDYHPQMENGGQ